MFPDANRNPSCSRQHLVRLSIAFRISQKLRRPVFGLGGGFVSVFCAPMPKASIDEEGDLGWSKHYVCASTSIPERPIVYAVAEAVPVQESSSGQFRSGVPGTVRMHDAAGSGVDTKDSETCAP